ncbi:MAG TPA: sigma-54 dependent transcriptional regulator [Polyangia bacterium]|nr:sigma-54 dependent transcriptional regulator [Polyangia bacterium]
MTAGAAPGEESLAVLFVDDEPDNLDLFRLQFSRQMPVLTACGAEAALALLAERNIGVLATDERMPGMSGIDLLATASRRWPEVVRMIVSAYSDSNRLLLAINRGHAHEYVLKPWDRDDLGACLNRALAMARRRRALAADLERGLRLEEDLRRDHDVGRLVGATSGLKATIDVCQRAAQSAATVLITGETGTGKELVARYVHEHSARASGPFVRVNCAALADGVIESELFGHEQGAFTGASRVRRGRFELASGGTIFLDEIGDVSARLQILLLRVLQEGELERVGGNVTLRTDVRVLAATHRDLPQRIAEGLFREDLYYRLNVIPVHVPPLRARPEDIPSLLAHFVRKHGGAGPAPHVEATVAARLCEYAWPGNVRELENVVQRALALAGDGGVLTIEDFCLDLALPPSATDVRDDARRHEAEQLRSLLISHGGNCARAASALGIPRTTLASRAKRLGLLR